LSFNLRSVFLDRSAACANGKYRIVFGADWIVGFFRSSKSHIAIGLRVALMLPLVTSAICAAATPALDLLPNAPASGMAAQGSDFNEPSTAQSQSRSSQQAPQPQPNAPDQQTAPSAGAATPNTAPAATINTTVQGKERQALSEEQLKKQEQQRILGIIPAFNSVYAGSVPPLTPGQKMRLMFKSTTDIYVFGFAAITAGIGQAQNSHEDYGQGVEGYAKRYAANYADTADGNFWGNAVLPIVLHEDPRYFRLGTGTFTHRLLYSMSTTVWCRRDNGTTGPNYANVLGNLIAGGISNVYYPAEDRGAAQTFQNAATVTAEGMIGAAMIEFWPDILRHHQVKRQARLAAAAAARAAQQQTQPAGQPPQ
jgi:hypothetical protein